jgi:hypothetical protein
MTKTDDSESGERTYTRREWLTRQAIVNGGSGLVKRAKSAVSAVGAEHPELDMDGERKTMAEWEIAENNG